MTSFTDAGRIDFTLSGESSQFGILTRPFRDLFSVDKRYLTTGVDYLVLTRHFFGGERKTQKKLETVI